MASSKRLCFLITLKKKKNNNNCSKMGKKKNRSDQFHKFRFSRNQRIGLPAAESEHNFSDLFIDTQDYEALADITNPKCIIIGRTGVGKSALIRRLEETQQKIKRISPEEMSLRFLSNSTILDYLRKIGVNLNFFYKILWKHVFIIELINLYAGDNQYRRQSFLQRIKEAITGEQKAKKQKAISYLEEFSNDFWEATELRVKSFENTLETSLSNELGVNPNIFKGSIAEINKLINKEELEVKQKAEKVINELQAEKLFELINIFKKDVFFDFQKKYFIIVDDLDKDWVSQQIVYDLIAAMVEVVQEFHNNFKGVKIVLSLRDNLHMLVISGSEHRGGQREKLGALNIHLRWSKEDLLELLNRRLEGLSNSQISTNTLFEKSYKNEGIDYILDRTYMRPRALISFVNKIIEQADRKTQFTQNLVKAAEAIYSAERLHAIDDEWEENYGKISKLCQFLIGKNVSIQIDSITENDFEGLYFEDCYCKLFRGKALEICENVKLEKITFDHFRREYLVRQTKRILNGLDVPG
jgi:hypothetical protein